MIQSQFSSKHCPASKKQHQSFQQVPQNDTWHIQETKVFSVPEESWQERNLCIFLKSKGKREVNTGTYIQAGLIKINDKVVCVCWNEYSCVCPLLIILSDHKKYGLNICLTLRKKKKKKKKHDVLIGACKALVLIYVITQISPSNGGNHI